jgi:beta-aspartyl-peptidase (threonine type)
MPISLRRLSVPLAGALALSALLAGYRIGHAADDEAAAIRKVLDKQVDDWNKKDLDAFLEGYWRSPKVVFQSGPTRFDGFDAMRDRYQKTYQADGKEMGKLKFTDVDVVVLAADAALVRGRFQLTMSDGRTPSGIYTLVMRKLPEGWRIIHDHTSS